MRLALVALVLCVAVADAAPKRPPGAIVLVIDRSGSMQGPKLDTAKTAALAMIDALAADDQVAVVAFDSETQTYVPLQRAGNHAQIAKQLSGLKAGGGTQILPGLQSAFELLKPLKVARKHVILLTDGEAPDEGLVDLVHAMHDAHVTITCIGVEGADRNLLSEIADAGDGSLHMVDDLKALSKLFTADALAALR